MEWNPYVPAGVRRARARREMDKLRRKGKNVQPVEIEGRTIARSFWGKRWCDHLESFSDYANRLPRGRTYVRNGSVCHLEIRSGRIAAIVSGSELYDVAIRIGTLKAAVWKSIKARCSGQIGSVLELLQGKLSRQVMGVVTDREHGLFPKPGEIRFDCSCPDWATMCKHVAAVLYGVGSRLDEHPESLFLLRGVDSAELIATGMALPGDAATDDALAEDALAGIFGIDLDLDPEDASAPPPPPKASAKPRRAAGRRAAPAPGRRAAPVPGRQAAPPASKARKVAASAGKARKAASSAPRKANTSPAAPPRKRAAAKARDLPASTVSAGRARNTVSSVSRGTKTSPAATPRKRAAAKARDLPASTVSAGRARNTASSVSRGTKTPATATPRKRAAARTPADASPTDIRPTGKWVARLRRRCGLSVAQFAARLGVSVVTVYRWEATPGRLNLHTRPLNALTVLYRRSGKAAG